MKYYADGYCLIRNPSNLGGGYTVVDQNNKLVFNKTIYKKGITNNECELRACLEALRICGKRDTIVVDSQVTLKWITNIFKKKIKKVRIDLDDLKKEAHMLMRKKNIYLIWKPREYNLAGIWNENRRYDNREYKSIEEIEDELEPIDLSWIR